MAPIAGGSKKFITTTTHLNPNANEYYPSSLAIYWSYFSTFGLYFPSNTNIHHHYTNYNGGCYASTPYSFRVMHSNTPPSRRQVRGAETTTSSSRKRSYNRVTENPIRRKYAGEKRKEVGVNLQQKQLNPTGTETTAMIKNIPNQYTRKMLIEFLDQFCKYENQKLKLSTTNKGNTPLVAYDFLYLPIDFMTNANKGYAFVNFTHPTAVWRLHIACYNQPWELVRSPKRCQIAYATIQGKEKLIKHFGNTNFECDNLQFLPVIFSPPRNGSSNISLTQTTTIGHLHFSTSL